MDNSMYFNEEIPLCIPSIGEEEFSEVKKVFESGWLTHGPQCQSLSSEFSDFIGCKKSLPVNSCTSALIAVLLAAGIKGEVILPSFTFVASANAVRIAGAVPVFVDSQLSSRNIDPEAVESAITPRTEAIMCVHYAGLSCDMQSLKRIAKRHNLLLIEDSAEAIGAKYKNKQVGSFGIGCFSFFPTKNITCGEGGMITFYSEEYYEKARSLIGHGIVSNTYERYGLKQPWYRNAVRCGYNFRLSDINAAICRVQLRKLHKMNKRRRNIALLYNSLLKDIKEIELPEETEYYYHVYQMYTVLVSNTELRDKLVNSLNKFKIRASVHFDPPVHLQTAYEEYNNQPLPHAEHLSKRIMTLPCYPDMTDTQVERVCKTIKKIIKADV